MGTAAQGRQMCGAGQTLFESITRRRALPSGADSGGMHFLFNVLGKRCGRQGDASIGKRKGNEVVVFSCRWYLELKEETEGPSPRGWIQPHGSVEGLRLGPPDCQHQLCIHSSALLCLHLE